MGKNVKEMVTYWGPSIQDWTGPEERRFIVERDEDLLKQGAEGRSLEKISLNDIFEDGVVTGVDMKDGYVPLVLFANEDVIIEVANCDREQDGWHRNLGADELAFQYKGNRTLETEMGDVTINEGEMTVVPRGVAHKNVGLGENIEIVIYCRRSLKRLAPSDKDAAIAQMKLSGGKPAKKPITLDDPTPE